MSLTASIERTVRARVTDALFYVDHGWTEEDALAKVRESSTLGPAAWARVEFYFQRGLRFLCVQRAIRDGRAYLDTAFGRRKVVCYRDESGEAVTNNTGRDTDRRELTDDDLRLCAPSIFASQPWETMSESYRFIPTIEVVHLLREQGFVPTKAAQNRTSIPGKGTFTKHMIRFRQATLLRDLKLHEEVPELVLVNSHDGSAAYQFLSGIFRLVCGNGLVIQSADFGAVSVRHTGAIDFSERIIDATFEVVEQSPKSLAAIHEWKQIALEPPQREAFAAAALAIVPDKPLRVPQLLAARRTQDMARDLWTTANVVQENLLKGGQRTTASNGSRTKTRPIRSVSEDLRVNRALWQLTEQTARTL